MAFVHMLKGIKRVSPGLLVRFCLDTDWSSV